jgi:hypothetical protein
MTNDKDKADNKALEVLKHLFEMFSKGLKGEDYSEAKKAHEKALEEAKQEQEKQKCIDRQLTLTVESHWISLPFLSGQLYLN